MNHYHQLVSLPFSLHDCMSLDQNSRLMSVGISTDIDRGLMATNTLKFLLLITEFLDTEIAPAIKPTPPPQKKKRVKILTQSIGLLQ